jgi:hypothetical protein
MRTTSFLIPADSLQLGTIFTEPVRCAGRQRQMAQFRSEIEPEHCLYKLCREAATPKRHRLELISFLFFGALVSAATVYYVTELFYVVNSGALEQTVQTLLPK